MHTTELWVNRLRTVDWLAVQVLVIAGFHTLMWSALLFAPAAQVVTAGTLPVLDMVPGLSITAHRRAWAVVFLACAALLAAVWLRPTIRRQLLTWLVVIPVGFMWAGTFALAVIDGSGSALGLTIWVTLLCWWGTVAVGVGVRQPALTER